MEVMILFQNNSNAALEYTPHVSNARTIIILSEL